MSAASAATRGGWIDRLAVAAAALVVLAVVAPRVDPISRDGASYLDVARNLLEGEGLVQRVVDFWRPAIPDPLGLWPPLYPLLTAALAACGPSPDVAARAVSALAFVGFALALHGLARRALGRGAALAVAVVAVAQPGAAVAGASIWSETTYLALVTLGLWAMAALRDAPGRARLAAASGLCIGLAALTRYQGLPLAALGIAFLIGWRTPARTIATWALPALALPALWLARVAATAGQLGPAPASLPRGAGEAALALLGALRWGFLPGTLAGSPAIAAALLTAVALGLLLAFRRGGAAALAAGYAALSLASLAAGDAGGLFHTLVVRYAIPVAPFLWLTSAAAAESLAARAPALRRAVRLAAMVVVAISAAALVRLAREWPSPSAGVVARAREAEALRALLPPGAEPVLSNAGHELRLSTGRSAVQVPDGGYRLRDFAAPDEERWRARGVRDAVFRIEPSGGATDEPRERFGGWLAARLGLAPGEAWAVIDSSAGFVRYRLGP